MTELHQRLRLDPDAPMPLAAQLASQLTWYVASGQLRPSESLPPIRQLAHDLGINMHTVRAAYRLLEHDGLVESRQGSGTRVAAFDRVRVGSAVPGLPTFTIGVLIPSYSPFYTPFLEAVEAAAEAEPLMFLVCNTREDSNRVARWLDQLVSKGVDGILIASRGLPDDLAAEPGVGLPAGLPPMVFADIPDAPMPRVLFDHASGGRLLAEHVLEHSFRRPGVIVPPRSWSNVAEVYQAMEAALSRAGLHLAPEQVMEVEGFDFESGRSAAERLMATAEKPDALVALGDNLALGALQGLKGLGLGVPGDVALIGYGGTAVAEMVDPPITTVHLDVAAMGKASMNLLRALMDGDSAAADVQIPVQLVRGRSCGCS